MTDATAVAPETDQKPSKMPVILGIALALAGGGGGFFIAQSGFFPFGDSGETGRPLNAVAPLPEIAYVQIDPMIVTLSADRRTRQLRFAAALEMNAGFENDVETLMPRVLDMLNGYLRALELADIEQTYALTKLRAQMLRRVQVLVGEGRVRDLMITEFVLN